ncbi:MAG: glycosyltransferase family 4 protein [Candidatus Omnitrophica bacterium]|nr:glycosyltransferase family 4 protein [Candidatus Omnitrophota bacterium]
MENHKHKIMLLANSDWYLYNFRLPLARAIKNIGVDVVLVSPPGAYSKEFVKQELRWIPWPLKRRSLNPFAEAIAIFRLLMIYVKEAPDLVHHFTLKCIIYGSIAAWLSGIRYRVNAFVGMGYLFSHHDAITILFRKIVSILIKISMANSASVVIVQNRRDYQTVVQEKWIAEDKVRLIRGSGINVHSIQPVLRNRRDSNKIFKVLMATRLLREKGVEEYVAAARILKREIPAIEFTLAGDFDDGNPGCLCEQNIREWQDHGAIKFIGHQDNMMTLMHESDVVVLPSYREGLPKILLEAAACALPIIATDIPGCNDVVEDGVNGLLIPVRDVPALVRAIQYLYQNSQKRSDMGIAGRKKVMAEFDQAFVIRQTFDAYGLFFPNLFEVSKEVRV